MITATPRIWIAGEEVPLSSEGAPSHLALDGLQIDWGTTERFSDVVPSTLQFRVLDPSGDWIAGRVLPGVDVKVAYSWDVPGSAGTRNMFQGMITSSNITPRKWEREGQEDWGYVIDITAIDRIGQLGNVFLNFASNTAATSTSTYRATKINQAAGNTFAAIETDTASHEMTHEVYTNSSALTVLDDIYRGAQIWAEGKPEYDPHTNRIAMGTWGVLDAWSFAGFYKDAATGKYGIAPSSGPGGSFGGGPVVPNWTLPAEFVESSGQLSRNLDASLTQITVKGWTNAIGSEAYEYYERKAVTIPNYRGIGDRSLSTETKFVTRAFTYAFTLATDAEHCRWRWNIEDVEWDVNRFGGFTNVEAMHQWLQPRTNKQRVFLAGTAHAHLADYYPLYEALGGTITYRDDGWHIAPKLAPWSYDLDRCEPLRFEQWGSTNATNPTLGEIDQTVRLSDMQYTDRPVTETI